MTPLQVASNPFVLMTNPEEVLEAIEHSERLSSLTSHVYHPLDKPQLSPADDESSRSAARRFDASMD